MATADTFTNEELLAYIDERLPPTRAADLERQLRGSEELLNRLAELVQSVEHGEVTLGGMWRRGRWSCPPRAVWAGFISGRLGDGLSQYLQFHLETAGCRICAASVSDLRRSDCSDTDNRVRKIFQSSAGGLRSRDAEE
jgi:anti-sigma factor RsiW